MARLRLLRRSRDPHPHGGPLRTRSPDPDRAGGRHPRDRLGYRLGRRALDHGDRDPERDRHRSCRRAVALLAVLPDHDGAQNAVRAVRPQPPKQLRLRTARPGGRPIERVPPSPLPLDRQRPVRIDTNDCIEQRADDVLRGLVVSGWIEMVMRVRPDVPEPRDRRVEEPEDALLVGV